MSSVWFLTSPGAAIRPSTGLFTRTGGISVEQRPSQKRHVPVVVRAKKKKAMAEQIESIQQLSANVVKQIASLRKEVATIQTEDHGREGPAIEAQENPQREWQRLMYQLVDRQEKFFKEEREYWIAERDRWSAQEKDLRKEISRLQGLLFEKNAKKSSSSKQTAPPETPNSQRQEALSHFNVRESIAAAIAAVEDGDVLNGDYNEIMNPVLGRTAPQPVEESVHKEPEEPVETVKSPPTGPPPLLTIGDDDIYWVSQLQTALNEKGFYCGDDDAGDFYFGNGTQSALQTFQACEGLRESGATDKDTWQKLLGPGLKPVNGDVPEQPPVEENAAEPVGGKETEEDVAFPVLSEYDGGRDVHCLQVILEIAGYSCGKDDMMWWHYGDGTTAAVKTYQACHSLPESGVADAVTWSNLAGNGNTMKDVRSRVRQENIYEEDMTQSNRVWLIGEQRWERSVKNSTV